MDLIPSILDLLYAVEGSEVFKSPVSKKDFPTYYKEIAEPMDFSTIQKKLKAKSYENAGAVYEDLSLIWNNCMAFNAKGSDIFKLAELLSKRSKSLFESKFGKNFLTLTSASNTPAKKQSSDDISSSKSGLKRPIKESELILKVGPLTKRIMQSIVSQMKAHERCEPFLYPVDVNAAPGYLEVVDKPMDISTIEKNIKSGVYKDEDEVDGSGFSSGSLLFVTDIRLIWGNCNEYNEPSSEIARWSSELGAYFEELLVNACREEGIVMKTAKKPKVGDDIVSTSSASKPSKVEPRNSSLSKKSMQSIVSQMKAHERCEPFLYPVDVNAAPGYLEVVDKPMDISTIEKNIKSGVYKDEDEVDGSGFSSGSLLFVTDIRLIWGNCNEYNEPSSEIARWSSELGAYFEELLVNACREEGIVMKTAKRARAVSGEVMPLSSKGIGIKVDNPSNSSLSKKSMQSIVSQMKAHERCEPFLYPVDVNAAPGYLEVVDKPMDISTIEKNIKSGVYKDEDEVDGSGFSSGSLLFVTDIRLIWGNCNEYNEPSSEIARWSSELGAYFEELLVNVCREEGIVMKKSGTPRTEKKVTPVKTTNSVVTTPKSKQVDTVPPVTPAAAPSSGSKSSKKFAGKVAQLSNEMMFSLMAKLKLHPRVQPFLYPVDVNAAPGYLEVVDKPMDISTIEKNIKSGVYKDSKPNDPYSIGSSAFADDVRLIWINCNAYNDPLSDLAKGVNELGLYFEEILMDLCRDNGIMFKPQYYSQSKQKFVVEGPESGSSAVKVESDDVPKKKLKSLFNVDEMLANGVPSIPDKIMTGPAVAKLIYVFNIMINTNVSDFFRTPVNVAATPGYADVVKKPMDFETMQKQIATVYASYPQQFRHDMELIFSNCQLYNAPGSDIHSASVKLQTVFGKLFDRLTARPNATSNSVASYQKDVNVIVSKSNVPAGLVLPANLTAQASHVQQANRAQASVQQHVPVVPSITGPLVVHAAQDSLPHISAAFNIPYVDTNLREKTLQLLQSNGKGYLDLLTSAGIMQAKTLLVNTTLPFRSGSWEVINWGREIGWVREYLYPVEYLCKKTLQAQSKSSAGSDMLREGEFLEIDFLNAISMEVQGGVPIPLFTIALSGSNVIVAKELDPQSAWKVVLGKTNKILGFLGRSMRRCGAVFNRMCASADAVSFLEAVPETVTTYYNEIKAPISFRDVFDKLVLKADGNGGVYQNEFEFAWDMRLVLNNAMKYNMNGSDIFASADRLSHLFEFLMCQWVYSVHEMSLDEAVSGPWDEWMSLKYYAGSSADSTDDADSPFYCCLCQECVPILDPASAPVRRKDVLCNRCINAKKFAQKLEKHVAALTSSSSGKVDAISFQSYGIPGKVFSPAYEFGFGWCAVRQPKTMTTTYMSPFGFEVNLRDHVYNQISNEKSQNEMLIKQREALIKSNKVRVYGTKSLTKSKLANSTFILGNDASVAGTFVWFDKFFCPTPIATTDLPPTGFFGLDVLDIRMRLEGMKGIERFAVSTSTTRSCYSLCGLDDNNTSATKLGLRCSSKLKNLMIDELLSDKGHRDIVNAGIKKATEAVANERWFWTKFDQGFVSSEGLNSKSPLLRGPNISRISNSAVETNECISMESSANKSPNNAGIAIKILIEDDFKDVPNDSNDFLKRTLCSKLFFDGISNEEGEQLLCIWDFIDASRNYFGDLCIGFTDIMKAVIPPPSTFPTISQVVFDELGCVFAGFLLEELRLVIKAQSTYSWHELVASRPVNLITWPWVVHDLLTILLPHKKFPNIITMSDVLKILKYPSGTKDESTMLDLLCLLVNHPMIQCFLDGTSFTTVSLNEAGEEIPHTRMTVVKLKNKVVNSLVTSSLRNGTVAATCYSKLGEFIEDFQSLCCDNECDFPQECGVLGEWIVQILSVYELSQYCKLTSSNTTTKAECNVVARNNLFNSIQDLTNMKSDIGFGSYYAANGSEIPTHIRPDISEKNDTKQTKVLKNLETSLRMLLLQDSEAFSTSDRITLFYLLVSFAGSCECYRDIISKKTDALIGGKIIPPLPPAANAVSLSPSSNLATSSSTTGETVDESANSIREKNVFMASNGSIKDISLIVDVPKDPPASSNWGNISAVSPVPAGVTCYFSGLKLSDVLQSVESWVIVPKEFLSPPVVSDGESDNDKMEVEESIQIQYALKSIFLRIVSARELAIAERKIIENNRVDKLNRLILPHSPLSAPIGIKLTGSCRYLNSAPLGHDRFGFEYWLIGCQETYPLGCFNKIGLIPSGTSSSLVKHDPSILVRDNDGNWWKIEDVNDSNSNNALHYLVTEKLDDEFPCERGLRNAIIDRLFAAKQRIISGLLTYRNMQVAEWFNEQRNFEKWFHHIHSNVNSILANISETPSDIVRMMELVYARCCESRYLLYCAKFNRDDIAKFGDPYLLRTERNIQLRLKRLREVLLDEAGDCHPMKGWYRSDTFGRCREISCTTIATKLLNDPSMYQLYQFQMRRLRFRKPEVLIAAVPVPQPAVIVNPPAVIKESEDMDKEDAMEVDDKSNKADEEDDEDAEEESQKDGKDEKDEEEARMEREEDDRLAKEEEDERLEDERIKKEEELGVNVQGDTGTEGMEVAYSLPNNEYGAPNIEERQRLFAEVYASHGNNVHLKSSSNRNRGDGIHITKGIEQLHIETGKVLRRYGSGKDASQAMQVSNSGISLCCTGVKPDAYGFKWRFYVGNISDFDKPYFNEGPDIMPIHELFKLRQNCRPLKGIDGISLVQPLGGTGYNRTYRSAVSTSSSSGNMDAVRSGIAENLLQLQMAQTNNSGRPSRAAAAKALENISTYNEDENGKPRKAEFVVRAPIVSYPVAPVPHVPVVPLPKPYTEGNQLNVKVSTVLVNHKIAKLKAELLNIYFVFPENQLLWDNVKSEHGMKYGDEVIVPTCTDDYLKCVQLAANATDLMKCVLLLETLLSPIALYGYNSRLVPTVSSSGEGAVSTAAVAVRIYTLDRSLKYEDVAVDLRSCGKYRPRTHFAPKCMISSQCVKPWCHVGRCGILGPRQPNGEQFSRYEPIPDIGVDPNRVNAPLVYPPSQSGAGNGVNPIAEGKMHMDRSRQPHGYNSNAVVGSNYYMNKERLQSIVPPKKKSFIASDSEDEDEEEEETDEEDEADSEDENTRQKKLTRYDVDHDDIVPAYPKYELILQTAWV